MIVFTAGHGDAVGSNGGVANKGGLMVEETMQIPLLLSGPGISHGMTHYSLVSNIDLVPTVLDICGILNNRPFHGESLLSLADGSQSSVREGLMTQHYGLHQRVVQRAYYRDDYKFIIQDDGFMELYNLAHDPCEMNNLVQMPDYADALADLSAGLFSVMRKTNDTANPIFNLLD